MGGERVRINHPKLRQLAPGIFLDHIEEGGRGGPDDIVLADTPGGQTWMSVWFLGSEEDDFRLSIPDVRMPANQYWPLHWHDCWVAVVILDGTCLVGDWWMEPGDVLIAEAGLEYGPVLPGPSGVQMFEVFARHESRRGGYATEYRDHPTLNGQPFDFLARSPRNQRNEGRQSLPVDGTEGLAKGRLEAGALFDLGWPDDPERGVMYVTRLAANERISPHSFGDARMMIVLEGDLSLGGTPIQKDGAVLCERAAHVPEIVAGKAGALLLEVTRTTAGADRQFR
jgi:hypothetical protein